MARDPELYVFEEQRGGDVLVTRIDLTDKMGGIVEIENIEWDSNFREFMIQHLLNYTSLGFLRLRKDHLTYNKLWSRT